MKPTSGHADIVTEVDSQRIIKQQVCLLKQLSKWVTEAGEY